MFTRRHTELPDLVLCSLAGSCTAAKMCTREHDAGMKFTIAATGAVVDGATVRHVAYMRAVDWPWALAAVPIASMLTLPGIAWIDFVLHEGDGGVYVIVAPESLDREIQIQIQIQIQNMLVTQVKPQRGAWARTQHGVVCSLWDGGAVYLDGDIVRGSTDGWGAPMAAGERVRLVYVDATRMVSVVWRGTSIDLVPLPAHHDTASMRFGVLLARGHTVCITSSSASTWAALRVRPVQM